VHVNEAAVVRDHPVCEVVARADLARVSPRPEHAREVVGMDAGDPEVGIVDELGGPVAQDPFDLSPDVRGFARANRVAHLDPPDVADRRDLREPLRRSRSTAVHQGCGVWQSR
jgi:hypothetical protein